MRLFEPLPNRLPAISTQDFRLFLPDILLFYDHLRERASIYLYDFSTGTEERLSEQTGALYYPKIDGAYVAWIDCNVGSF